MTNKIGSLVEELLDCTSGGNYSRLRLEYFQCGDEDSGGNYIPPHYHVELDLESRGKFEAFDQDLAQALTEVLDDIRLMEKKEERELHNQTGMHNADCCPEE